MGVEKFFYLELRAVKWWDEMMEIFFSAAISFRRRSPNLQSLPAHLCRDPRF
jgi:hypothetical protein